MKELNGGEAAIKWAGHVERMAEDRLTKTADAYGDEGRRRRGRPRLRWKDYVRNEGIKGNWRGIGARQKIMEKNSAEDH